MSAGIGAALTVLREYTGWSVEDAAKAAGVGAVYLAAVEQGTNDATPVWVGSVSAVYAARIASLRPSA